MKTVIPFATLALVLFSFTAQAKGGACKKVAAACAKAGHKSKAAKKQCVKTIKENGSMAGVHVPASVVAACQKSKH